MTAYTLVPVPAGRDLPCLACDRMGRSWAFRADVIVRSRAASGMLDDWMCWSCFDVWREIPEVTALPVVSRKAVGIIPPFSFYQTRSC